MPQEMILLAILPMLACVILTVVHAYLGLHVVRRGIIFADLCLAQMAALGSCVATVWDYGMKSHENHAISLAFTLVGAIFFTWSRQLGKRIPQEAIIGIGYAVASAGTLIVLNHSPQGGEEIKALLVGDIFFVSIGDIVLMLLVYGMVGLFHWFYREKLYTISKNYGQHTPMKKGDWFLDFLFYATFGLVVTSSVRVAGVLLVFSFLITPVVIAMLFSSGMIKQLFIAWAVGVSACAIGFGLSYQFDAPVGATIVCTLGALLLMSLILVLPFSRIAGWKNQTG